MKRIEATAAAFLTAIVICGTGTAVAMSTTQTTVSGTETFTIPQPPAPPVCAGVLPLLPHRPPATLGQASADIRSLQGLASKGTPLWHLTATVQEDLRRLSSGLVGARQTAHADLASYKAAVKQLRGYCS
jgi:hypothetical protein